MPLPKQSRWEWAIETHCICRSRHGHPVAVAQHSCIRVQCEFQCITIKSTPTSFVTEIYMCTCIINSCTIVDYGRTNRCEPGALHILNELRAIRHAFGHEESRHGLAPWRSIRQTTAAALLGIEYAPLHVMGQGCQSYDGNGITRAFHHCCCQS